MYFILNGTIDIHYKRDPQSLIYLKQGSYFGEVSYLFKLKNKYSYVPRTKQNYSLFSLKNTYLESIFELYPNFKSMLKIRALWRHRYIRRLRKQNERLK